MNKSTITRERLEKIKSWRETYGAGSNVMLPAEEAEELARMALTAMDSSESVELPLDYLQGHKDGLEWASQLAEANHPETGDWLYDDPIELAKVIRKGPDMPPVQSVAGSEPVAWQYRVSAGPATGWSLWHDGKGEQYENSYKVERRPLYLHAQPAPVELANIALPHSWLDGEGVEVMSANEVKRACRAAMLAAAPQEVKDVKAN